MRRHRTRGPIGALLTLTAAGGLLLTGCGGGDEDAARGAKDTAVDSRGRGSAPVPAPDGPRGEAGQRHDEGATTGGTGDSREVAPEPDLLSTFALDVDTASYGYARRTLAEGRLPDPSTVRPEEFVNSFRQDYERPEGDGFSVTVDGARTGEEDWSLVRVGLATRGAEQRGARPPAALTFVIDVSGSMAEPGRLDLAQEALGTMTDRLRDDDSVALVTFSDEAETVLPMTRLGDRRGRVHDAIDSLEPTQSPTSARASRPATTPPSRAAARAPPTASSSSPTPSPTPARPTRTPSSNASRTSAASTASPSSASASAATTATP